MNTAVFLKINAETYTQFTHIYHQLVQGSKVNQADALGKVLSQMACEVVEQVFMVLLKENQQYSKTGESEKVIQQILDAIRKYMPWSISLFNNERLVPLVEYLLKTFQQEGEMTYMTYPVNAQLAQQVQLASQRLIQATTADISNILHLLTEVIDQGVTHLIREPKKCLKFNFMVDKTLNGVIHMTTHLGYKRLEKLATQIDQAGATIYVEHFMQFMRQQDNEEKAKKPTE